MPFIYIINIGFWQVLFITFKQLGKSYSATSFFKCGRGGGFIAAVLVLKLNQNLKSLRSMKCLIFNTRMIFVLFNSIKTGSVMSKLVVLLARVSISSIVFLCSSISKFSTSLLKSFKKFLLDPQKSLLREDRTDIFPKFSIVGENSMV